MTLRVLFFARIREQLGHTELSIALTEDTQSLDKLQESLCARQSGLWREVLSQDNIIRSVNQTIASGDCPLRDGDEVAFFPPVTGG